MKEMKIANRECSEGGGEAHRKMFASVMNGAKS